MDYSSLERIQLLMQLSWKIDQEDYTFNGECIFTFGVVILGFIEIKLYNVVNFGIMNCCFNFLF